MGSQCTAIDLIQSTKWHEMAIIGDKISVKLADKPITWCNQEHEKYACSRSCYGGSRTLAWLGSCGQERGERGGREEKGV